MMYIFLKDTWYFGKEEKEVVVEKKFAMYIFVRGMKKKEENRNKKEKERKKGKNNGEGNKVEWKGKKKEPR